MILKAQRKKHARKFFIYITNNILRKIETNLTGDRGEEAKNLKLPLRTNINLSILSRKFYK